jgi:hypothetical protein
MPELYPFHLCRTLGCRTPKEPGYADRELCQPHEVAGLEAIGRLPRDWSDLEPLIWDKGAARHDTGRIDSVFGPTEPIDIGADALARELVYTACVWEIAVRAQASLWDAPNQHAMGGYQDLARASRTLVAHYPVLLSIDRHEHMGYDRKPAVMDGVDAVISLTSLHRRAHNKVGFTRMTHEVPGGCGNCGRETLRHKDPDGREQDDVFCALCHWTCSWDVYVDVMQEIPA